ncbi:SCO family protein [Scopulibacillus darangshiensis]
MSVLILASALLTGCGHEKPHAFNWKVGNFQATDETGQDFGLSDLKGKVWLADFVFTHCQTVCPPMTRNMAALQEQLKKSEAKAQIVSFTVDPKRDSPDVLKKFAKEQGADLSNWHLLTGYSFDKIKSLSEKSFKSAVSKPAKGNDQYTHGTNIFLIDQKGTIVQKYNGYSDVPYDDIIKDVKALNE